jgi:hypothetical protein
MRSVPSGWAVVAVAFVLFGGEVQQAEWTRAPATVGEASGPAGSGLTIRELGRFSGFEGPDGAVFFASVRAVGLDRVGNAYVLDWRDPAVYVLDPDGRHLRTIGRTGAGPGEFPQPSGLLLTEDDHLWVFDPSALRYTVFRLDGAVVETLRRDFPAGYPYYWEPVGGADQRIYEAAPIRNPISGEDESVFLALAPGDRALEPVDTIRRFLDRSPPMWPVDRSAAGVRVQAGGGIALAPPREVMIPFSARSHDRLDPRGGFWTGHTDEMRFIRRSWTGDIVQIVERPDAEPRPATRGDRQGAIEELTARWGEGFRVRADPGQIPDHMPFWESFWVDPDGRVWVERFRPPGTPSSALPTWEVFGSDGAYLGAFELPLASGPSPALRGNRMIGVVKDDLGVDWVVLFEVTIEEREEEEGQFP